jgi:hypothetical protein
VNLRPTIGVVWIGALALMLGPVACGDDNNHKDAGMDGAKDGTGSDGTGSDVNSDVGSDLGSDRGDATGADTGDGGPPDVENLDHVIHEAGTDGASVAPMNLTATVLDRRATSFHLTWTAPSANGQAVSGYLVRAAKVPITEANFDDTANTTLDALYTGTPAAPGSPDQVDFKGLYIETGYYFAVAGLDASNRRGAIAATATAVKATFNTTALAGTNGAMEQFGFQFDGSGDVNGDGKSDLLVGSFAGKRAYLFFGAAGTFSTTPGVFFNGDATTTASFGRGVAQIGDIDNDGRPDIAISDRGTPAHIYIYKGRDTWPMTMSNTDANYVITVDATYMGSILGASMARLGDFNGDGVDDFALGAPSFGTMLNGRVVVIFGKTGFANITLPDATNSLVIDADPAVMGAQFGYRIVGIGRFYTVSAGTTMVVSAPGNSGAGSEGRLYAFHGRAGMAAALVATDADQTVVGPAVMTRIGLTLRNLGPMLNTLPSVGSGNPIDRVTTTNGNAYLFSGSATSGPLASKVVAAQGGGAALSGQALIGGGVSGTGQSFSLVGDPTPDLVLVSRDSTIFTIVDGQNVRAATSPFDVTTTKDAITITLPTDWTATAEDGATLLPDINGDGRSDFALSNALGTVAGKVVVYW